MSSRSLVPIMLLLFATTPASAEVSPCDAHTYTLGGTLDPSTSPLCEVTSGGYLCVFAATSAEGQSVTHCVPDATTFSIPETHNSNNIAVVIQPGAQFVLGTGSNITIGAHRLTMPAP